MENPENLIRQEPGAAVFYESFREALAAQRLRLSGSGTVYVLDLLVGHIRHDPLVEQRTFAETFGDADSFGGNRERSLRFQMLGDRALLTAGCWWERLARSPVGVDYVIAIGVRAYREVEREPFDELARKFPRVTNALAETMSRFWTPQNMLHAYGTWQCTGSPFLGRLLRARGLAPVLTSRSLQ